VGLDRIAKPGEVVKSGSVLARIHAADRGQANAAGARLKAAFGISAQPPRIAPLVAGMINWSMCQKKFPKR